MTDIAVFKQTLQTDDRSWDLTPPNQGVVRGGTLDVSALNQSQHYPNGYLKSGLVLALASGGSHSGFLVPYLDAGSNGAAVAVGVLFAAVTVVNPDGSLKAKVGCSRYVAFADIDPAKLPYTSSNAALGGYLDADAQTDLKLIHFGS